MISQGLKVALAILIGSCYVLCGNAVADNLPSQDEELVGAEQELLARAVAHTHFSALVVYYRVDILQMSNDKLGRKSEGLETNERQIYHARVIETFRGKPSATIRYELIADIGEGAQIDSKPRILTLCAGREGYYWPGTGASFRAEPALVAIARRAGQKATKTKSRNFKQCD